MPKIEINAVAEILKRNKADPALLRSVVEEMNILIRAEADEEKPPAVKKQFVLIVSDPEGHFPKRDFAGWALQIPDTESPVTTLERVYRAAYEFNTTKKGRLMPAKTVGDAIENIPAKHFKETEVWVKHKTPVLILTTDNLIPMDETSGKGKGKRRGGDDDE